MSAVVNQPLLKTVANGKTLSDFALSRMMVKKKRARRALLSAAATRERTRSPDRRLGLQVSCQVSRRIYRTQPTRIGSPVMSRLPQGCATFTRLVFILDLGSYARGYEPGGERASSAKAFVRMLGGRRSRFLVDSSHRPGLLNNSLEVCRHSNRTGGKREERARASRRVRAVSKPNQMRAEVVKSQPLPADQYKRMSIFGL